MCAIFGVLDYRGKLKPVQLRRMVKELGNTSEVRGTDATGIAFFVGDRLCIQKAPKPAHLMKYRIPAGVRYVMGHTRMTTQGDPKQNMNNHPFAGQAGEQRFALAHNGIIWNDAVLRSSEHLPETPIETDTYVAVQLIEAQKEVSFTSLRKMAEAVEGHFTFTVLDQNNDLYFVKGDNPLTIYHYPRMGVYLYASTVEILDKAANTLGIRSARRTIIEPDQGDILRIDRNGHCDRSMFDDANLFMDYPSPLFRRGPAAEITADEDTYLSDLKAVAWAYGYAPDTVDRLIDRGYRPEEIEAFLVERVFSQPDL